MPLGEKIRLLRVSEGLTQKELGRRVSLCQQAIHAIEIGKVARPPRMIEIARALNVHDSVFLGDLGAKPRILRSSAMPGQLAVAKQLLRFESPSVEWDDLGEADRDQFLIQAREVIAAYNGALAG